MEMRYECGAWSPVAVELLSACGNLRVGRELAMSLLLNGTNCGSCQLPRRPTKPSVFPSFRYDMLRGPVVFRPA